MTRAIAFFGRSSEALLPDARWTSHCGRFQMSCQAFARSRALTSCRASSNICNWMVSVHAERLCGRSVEVLSALETASPARTFRAPLRAPRASPGVKWRNFRGDYVRVNSVSRDGPEPVRTPFRMPAGSLAPRLPRFASPFRRPKRACCPENCGKGNRTRNFGAAAAPGAFRTMPQVLPGDACAIL